MAGRFVSTKNKIMNETETLTGLKELPYLKDGHWLFGAGLMFSKDPLFFINKYSTQYDGIFRIRTARFIEQIVIVTKPDYVKHILQDNNKNYQKSFGYKIMKLLVGNGLLTSEGDFWRRQRRLAQPGFHRERLASFNQIMVDEINELLKAWNQLPDGTEVNISKAMMEVTLKIVCKALFSTDVDDVTDTVSREFYVANESLIKRIIDPVKIPLWIPTPHNLKEDQAYKAIQGIVQQLIEKRRKSSERHDDLLAMLMEAKDEDTGEMMDNEQLKDEVVTLFLAGHETTAVALTWLFHCLDENREVEVKLLEEARNVLNGKDPELDDMRRLEYTRMVIDETMRLYPPAWIIGRNALEEDVIDGYRIPQNINTLIPVYQIHRNPEYWDEPLKFIPERFTKEKLKSYHKFVYFPFGGGPRLCIGNNFALMEMQLLVPMVVQQYQLRKPANFKFKQDPLITMRPNPDMMMQIFKRK
jgi:cytochrome P450